MSFLTKIFISISIFIWLTFFVFSTFLSPQYEWVNDILIEENYNVYNAISLESNTGVILNQLQSNSWVLLNEGEIFLEKLSNIDEIYSSNTSTYTKNIEDGKNIIELWKGLFLVKINDLTKEYLFSHKWFILKPLWTWMFYIDTLRASKITIFSKTSFLELWFKSIKAGNIINTAYLYPHEYIKFNPIKSESIKNNADFIRVKQQVFKGGYIYDKISNKSTIDSNIWKLLWEDALSFLKISLSKIHIDNLDNSKDFEKISEYKYWGFPWVEFIRKNISFFYNDSKKIVYYKNNIIDNIVKLFNLKDVKSSSIIDNINENLSLLKEIDQKEYDNVLNIINYFYNTTVLDNSLNNDTKKINFYNLVLKIKEEKRDVFYPSLIFSKSLYSLYDSEESINLDLYLNDFLLMLFKDLDIEIEGVLLSFSQDHVLKMDYLLYYLTSYLSFVFNSDSSFDDSLSLINNYILLNKAIYFDYLDESRIVTWIFEWVKFLKELDKSLRNNLFEKERDERSLLVLKSNIDKDLLNKLEKNIISFIEIFNDNIKKIEDKNWFNNVKENFSEYFLALLNYDKYTLEYDKTKKDALGIKTLWQKDAKKYTKDDFFKYISQFNGIDRNRLLNTKVEMPNWFYYEVKDLYINNHNFSFNLYPYDKNKIDSVQIDWNEKDEYKKFANRSYDLDVEEEKLKEKIKDVEPEDRYKYEFSNFFLNIFFPQVSTNTVIIQDDKEEKQEEKFVIVFKRNVLLWDEWEFSLIKNIIDINYSNLIVDRKDENYNIYIDSWLLHVPIKSWLKDEIKYWLLDSDYILNNNDHYFENTKLKIYQSYKDKEKKFLLSWNYINFNWKVNLLDFEDKLKLLFWNISNLSFVYNTIYSNFYSVNNLYISYIPDTNKISFSLKIDNNNVEIIFKWSTIERVTSNGKQISGISNISNLKNILLTIKNSWEENLQQK